jgi:membrane protein YqaA with SNARE-associated domain
MPVDLGTPSKHDVPTIRTIIVSVECGLVLALLVLWLASDTIRASKSLWILFGYSFPSQFLIAIVPHEPVYFFYSKFYAPIVVTLVATAGTVIAEYFNYSIFGYFAEFRPVQRAKQWGVVQKILRIFGKAPFAAIWIAGLSPIPFYPFRFMVVLSEYPLRKYLLAVFLSRMPRFFLLALVGGAVKLPNTAVIMFFVAMMIIIYVPVLKKAGSRISHSSSGQSASSGNVCANSKTP